MFKFRRMSARIALYAGALILIIAVGLGALAYYNGAAAVVREVERALQMQAVTAGEYLASRLEIPLAILELLADRAELKTMDWEQQAAVLQQELARTPEFLALGVVSPDGTTRYADGSTAALGDRDYVIRAFAGEPVISDMIVSRVTNSLVLMYAVPIKVGDSVLGVLIGRRDAGVVSEIADELGFGESGWAYVFGQDGTLFAHPDRELVFAQVSIFDPSTPLYAAGQAVQAAAGSGVIRYHLDDGDERIVGIAPVPSSTWTIAVGAMRDEVLAGVNQLRSVLIGLSLLFIAVGLVTAAAVGHRIANPLRRIQKVIAAVAAGDLTSISEVALHDEVGLVSTALNDTIARIREAISLVNSTTIELNSYSEGLAAAAQEVSASVEEVASTTNEFSSTLDQVNSNAQTVGSAASAVADRASQGEHALTSIVSQMQQLRQNAQQLAEDVSGLAKLSEEINSIVSLIGSIADQTDLLALNAAIEAARAGEHGRGFSVVADEVRNLAEQTGKAAEEITALIAQIQARISQTVQGMNQEAEQADLALGTVNESARILHEILTAVDGIVDQVQGITAGLTELNRGGHEIASATEEQAASMAEVAESAQNLTTLSIRLKELVGRFQLSRD